MKPKDKIIIANERQKSWLLVLLNKNVEFPFKIVENLKTK